MEEHEELAQIRQALLQANLLDYEEALTKAEEPPPPTAAHRRWEARFLRRPAARRNWRRGLQIAACAALTVVLTGIVFLDANAAAGQWMTRWITGGGEARTTEKLRGEAAAGQPQVWAPVHLPEGYEETDRLDQGNQRHLRYCGEDPGLWIEFSYQQGTDSGMGELEQERTTSSSVYINGHQGRFYPADRKDPNLLLWSDTENDVSFFLASWLPADTLIEIASSVTQVGLLDPWALTALPAGYAETDYTDWGSSVEIVYRAEDPAEEIVFSYMLLKEGAGLRGEKGSMIPERERVSIRGSIGQAHAATDGSPNLVMWFDEAAGYTFLLSSRLPIADLLPLAESAALVER